MTAKLSNILKFASAMALLLIAYFPVLLWMYHRWIAKESYYGHGFLIPLVSLFIIWQKKDILKSIKITSDIGGLALVAASLFIHILCAVLRIYFISGFTFILAIYGLVVFFFGRAAARMLAFPIFFLLAMVPLPLVAVSNLTVRLKLFAAQCAVFILNIIGFPSIRDGSMIIMPNSRLLVEAPCSGLRSLISLLTLGLLFAYTIKASFIKKAVLFLSSIPIAITTNIVRIIMLATVNDLYGEKIAMGLFHDFSGFFIFALAFIGLLGVSKTLELKRNAD